MHRHVQYALWVDWRYRFNSSAPLGWQLYGFYNDPNQAVEALKKRQGNHGADTYRAYKVVEMVEVTPGA